MTYDKVVDKRDMLLGREYIFCVLSLSNNALGVRTYFRKLSARRDPSQSIPIEPWERAKTLNDASTIQMISKVTF